MEASKKTAAEALVDTVRAQDPLRFFALGGELCRRTETEADRAAEDLDDAAWAHARVRCYADSVDQLAFVAAYKAAVLDEACEDDSQAARDGWRAGRRHRDAPGPRDEQWREEQKAAARGNPL